MARWFLVLALAALAGCAKPGDTDLEYLAQHNWTPLDSYVPEVRRVVEDHGFCVFVDIRGDDFVFSRTSERATGDKPAALAAAGLFQATPTTPELRNAQRGIDGDWYRITDLGRKFHRGGSRWCFGRRADITVTDAGTPAQSKFGVIQRTITYRYRIAEMPDFTQTEAFRKAIPAAPVNGAVLTDTIKLTFGWKGIWDLPQQNQMMET